jgi:hypothetical protein
MAEARLWLGEKTVMELDPITGGWFLKVQIDSAVATPVSVSENWRIGNYFDAGTGSNKLFTVPADEMWEILWVWAEFKTTGTAQTNRQLEIQLIDKYSDIMGAYQTSIVQADALTYNYLFGIAMPDLLSLRDTNYLITPLPAGMFLDEYQSIRIWDNNLVGGLDWLVIHMQYAYKPI